jgi:cyanate permease
VTEADRSISRGPTLRFYGWAIVALAFVVQAAGIGSLYICGLLVSGLRDSLHISTAEVLLWTATLLMLSMALLMPVGGMVLRRVSARSLAVIAMVLLAIGYAGLREVSATWHLALVFGIFLPAAAAGAVVAANTLVSNWFVAGRGVALGIATAGIMTGGAIMPPLAARLLDTGGLPHLGLVFAIGAALLVPVTFFVAVDKPEQRGAFPDGASMPPASEHAEDAVSAPSTRSILGHGTFWLIMSMIATFSAVTTALLSNFVPFAESLGFTKDHAAYLVSASSLSGAVGMIFLGGLLNKVGPRTLVGVPMLVAAAAAGLMGWQPEYAILFAASVAIGLVNGATSVAPGIVAGQFFGRSGFSLAFGIAMFLQTVLTAFAIPIYGASYDATGRYEPALYGVAGVTLVLAILGRFLPRSFQPPAPAMAAAAQAAAA